MVAMEDDDNDPLPSRRFEPVIATLAEIIHDGHLWECTRGMPCHMTICATDRVRAALEYLRDAGLIRKGYFAPILGTTELGRTMALRDMADDVRAKIMYDLSRGVVVWDFHLWLCLGWDVGLLGTHFRHPSEAVAELFKVPAWRPTQDELTWFRDGFVRQRKGSGRPMIRG